MKLRTVIYSLLLATLCMGCGGRLSMRELEDGKFSYHAQLDKPTNATIRAIFADGSLCEAYIEQVFVLGKKLNILVMDNKFVASYTPFIGNDQ